MATILELAILAGAAYCPAAPETKPGERPAATPKWNPDVSGWTTLGFKQPGGFSDSLQAVAFKRDHLTVLAFKGTDSGPDVADDVLLGAGMNTSSYAAAETFADDYKNNGEVVVCGHSLGGAIAQVVANRMGFKMATFNAPGVAVLASRHFVQNPIMAAFRTGGMIISAFYSPSQALRDVRATFTTVQGVNVRLNNDRVSQIGLHYGKVVSIPGTGFNPLSQHSIDTVIAVLKENGSIGRDELSTYC